ncbi:MAG: bifunctional phosphopantothenoylcysteine decarboxylase/phosphopantothenate--cysteine ligase CoaBC [Bacteroidetes bacterium]|nr:bifunctional phosphopantothenoylcysteine decarboxylase/phosphopantothenate--cysteine ligase CoaBC [Bacteroidota bacterium]
MRSRRILIGISGGIAAYKIPVLVRLLVKSGFEVKCILTPNASEFVSPLVLSTLSLNPVESNLISDDKRWINHVELAEWCDLFLIAPLTANTLAKMANGICDNLLLSTYFSMKGKVMVSPAMDLDMYAHPTVIRNIELIKNDGVLVLPAEFGELASGLLGYGRMMEPEKILEEVQKEFEKKNLKLKGKKVLITAGPTYENIDPVRFIGNHSSGKMGYALTKSFLSSGCEVILISGPTSLSIEHPKLTRINVISAEEMMKSVKKYWKKQSIGVFAAAVSDYRPEITEIQKIKKNKNNRDLKLVKNPDILEWAGLEKDNQLLVGFALETENGIEHASAKLKNKNLDYVVLNSTEDTGAGFGHDTNKVTILDKKMAKIELSLKSKYEIADEIVEIIAQSF